ncbi:HSF-type DNA-binding [Seminavis robusta]|uniref:HSF-type DNA-binding n=1 Tax=Seminavis robusta TaxID=568900 RepID=A0A9N8DNW6_9STRA|nr:HSF-type DNA-binding [Seminavis robusta]|eukprot:Sro243_g097020.1 HSF-type DNA-binding (546) ;mRNA; r:78123-79981
MKRSAESDSPSKRSTRRRRREGEGDANTDQTGGQQEVGSAAETVSSAVASSANGDLSVATAPAAAGRGSVAAAAHPGSTQQQSTYPQPRNFAERLMWVLESNAAPDTIWWEEDGQAVALHVDNLKTGDVLNQHFQGIKYKFFIRNFSRWGFRRNTAYTVPFGQFHYRNSLFQRDSPNLVRHMRMDSDVQDVFTRHQAAEDQARTRRRNPAAGEPTPAPSTSNTGAGANQLAVAAASLANPPAVAAAANQNNDGQAAQALSNIQQSPGNVPFNFSTILAGMALAAQSSGLQQAQPAAAPAAAQQPASSQQNSSAQPHPTAVHNFLLQLILQLAQVYLHLPPSPSQYSAAITSSLQLLYMTGQPYLQMNPQQPDPSTAAASLQQLAQAMSVSAVSTQHQPTMNLSPEASMMLLMTFLSQQQQQPQLPPQQQPQNPFLPAPVPQNPFLPAPVPQALAAPNNIANLAALFQPQPPQFPNLSQQQNLQQRNVGVPPPAAAPAQPMGGQTALQQQQDAMQQFMLALQQQSGAPPPQDGGQDDNERSDGQGT